MEKEKIDSIEKEYLEYVRHSRLDNYSPMIKAKYIQTRAVLENMGLLISHKTIDRLSERGTSIKTIEAEKFVIAYLKAKQIPPTYQCVADRFDISKTAAYASSAL